MIHRSERSRWLNQNSKNEEIIDSKMIRTTAEVVTQDLVGILNEWLNYTNCLSSLKKPS